MYLLFWLSFSDKTEICTQKDASHVKSITNSPSSEWKVFNTVMKKKFFT